MPSGSEEPARIPPRWFIRSAWAFHRALYRITGGHFGLWRPRSKGWGTMHLTTIGRRSGAERGVIPGYFEDGNRYVTLAMNGWADPEPAWWLNLQAHPEARLVVAGRQYTVRGRAATAGERDRLWARWQELDTDLDAYASRRSRETAVVVLEPVTTA